MSTSLVSHSRFTMATHHFYVVLATICLATWLCETTAAPVNNTDLPLVPTPQKASWPLLANKNENEQKHLNPQLLAYLLRPLTSYLVALSGPAGVAGPSPSYDDYGAPTTFALPPAPTKLSFLASLLGWGAPATGGVVNPSYARKT